MSDGEKRIATAGAALMGVGILLAVVAGNSYSTASLAYRDPSPIWIVLAGLVAAVGAVILVVQLVISGNRRH